LFDDLTDLSKKVERLNYLMAKQRSCVQQSPYCAMSQNTIS